MKLLKLRAWLPETKELLDVYEIIWEDDKIWRIKFKSLPGKGYHHEGANEYILLQFTGLQDHSEPPKDIYEGDQFEAVYKDCPDGYSIMGKETTVIRIPATVVFKWGKFCIEMMHPIDKELVWSDLFNFLKNTEKVIIGNIFETKPKLL
jgi:uncharacterized phage protein (TIGR01671 family)